MPKSPSIMNKKNIAPYKSSRFSNRAVFPRKPLVKKLLLIEGISRSGKFLLSDLLAGFADVEPVQTHVSLEHIPILEKQGLIDPAAAREFLRCEIDVYCYETLIGRTLNMRQSDKSTVFHHPRHEEFLKRAKAPDPQLLLREFNKSRSYSLFIVHELMPHIKLYFDTFPQMKILSLKRSPVDVVASWHKRGYGDRIAVDPTFFMIPFTVKNRPVPWYALKFKDEFYRLSPMDRIIRSVTSMYSMSDRAFAALPKQAKRRVLFVSFEELMIQPQKVVLKIRKFLGKETLPAMKDILKREKLPNPGRLEEKESKLKMIRKLASAENFRQLENLEREYQKTLKL